jgi:hypothetical protein
MSQNSEIKGAMNFLPEFAKNYSIFTPEPI